MLAYAPRGILLFLLVAIPVVAIAVVVGGVIWSIAKIRKSDSPFSKRIIILIFVSVIITATSWVLNFGWLRFCMTFLLIPIIHGIVFILSNLFFSGYSEKSPAMRKLNMFFIITYLLAYLLMPDGSDTGEMYFFFGLIHSNVLSEIAFSLSGIAVANHIALFVMQIIEIKKIKKNISDRV